MRAFSWKSPPGLLVGAKWCWHKQLLWHLIFEIETVSASHGLFLVSHSCLYVCSSLTQWTADSGCGTLRAWLHLFRRVLPCSVKLNPWNCDIFKQKCTYLHTPSSELHFGFSRWQFGLWSSSALLPLVVLPAIASPVTLTNTLGARHCRAAVCGNYIAVDVVEWQPVASVKQGSVTV